MEKGWFSKSFWPFSGHFWATVGPIWGFNLLVYACSIFWSPFRDQVLAICGHFWTLLTSNSVTLGPRSTIFDRLGDPLLGTLGHQMHDVWHFGPYQAIKSTKYDTQGSGWWLARSDAYSVACLVAQSVTCPESDRVTN